MDCLKLLKKIPKGKVISYSELARVCRKSPREIGRLLHNNSQLEKYPCYKVVYKDGRIGGYVLGVNEKIRRLKRDGIKIIKGKIPKEFFFNFS